VHVNAFIVGANIQGKNIRISTAYQETGGDIEIFRNGTSLGLAHVDQIYTYNHTIAGRFDPASGLQQPNVYKGNLNPFAGIGSINLSAGDVIAYTSASATSIAFAPFGVVPIYGIR
jgi:hypothetical protein